MFLHNAKLGKNNWWRYVLSLVIIFTGISIGQIPMLMVLKAQQLKLNISDEEFATHVSNMSLDAFEISSTIGLLFILTPFTLSFLAFAFTFKPIFKRKFVTLLTGRTRLDWKRVFSGFIFWIFAATILIFILIPDLGEAYQFELSAFIPLFIIAILLIPFQTTLEEIIFRGFIFQGIGLFTKRATIPLIVSSVLFAAAHLANPEFQQGFLRVMPVYLMFSLMFGVIAILDNGMELSIGIHAANNIFTALILSTSNGAMNTASIFKTNTETLFAILPYLLPVLVIITLIVYGIKYKWQFKTLYS